MRRMVRVRLCVYVLVCVSRCLFVLYTQAELFGRKRKNKIQIVRKRGIVLSLLPANVISTGWFSYIPFAFRSLEWRIRRIFYVYMIWIYTTMTKSFSFSTAFILSRLVKFVYLFLNKEIGAWLPRSNKLSKSILGNAWSK